MKIPTLRLPCAHPETPGPGVEKVRAAGYAGRAWLVACLILAVAAAVAGPHGLSDALGRMRTEFVAVRYVQTAAEGLQAKPLDRATVIASVDRAVDLAPRHRIIERQSGPLYMHAGAYERAVAAFDTHAGRDLNSDISLGHCLLLSGEIARGRELLLDALQTVHQNRSLGTLGDRAYAMSMNNIGYALADGNVDLQQAQKLVRQAVEMEPLHPAYVDSLGWVYYRMGDYRKAAFYLERAVRHGGQYNSAEIYYHLGAANARLGRIRPAARALLRALEQDPQHEQAIDELRRLRYVLPQPIRV